MKVLMVHHGAGVGGAPKSMSYLARALQKKDKVQTEILFLQDSSAITLFEDIDLKKHVSKFPIYYFYHMSKWVRLWQVHKLAMQVVSFALQTFIVAPYYLLKIKPDVVYLNTSVLPDWFIASKLLRKRVVVHVRESVSEGHFGLRRHMLKSLYSFADKVVFISQDNADRLCMGDSDNAIVVYNYSYVDSPPVVDKVYDFIYLGGEEYIKGWSLIKALLNSNLSFSICIAGNYAEDTVRWLKKLDNVTFMGVIDNSEREIGRAKYLLSPFLEPHFSRPIIEAYAVNTIPVASLLVGIDEQVLDKKTGFLFDPSTTDDFINLCESLLSLEYDLYKGIVDEGYQFYSKRFTSENESVIVNTIIDASF